MTIKHPGNPSLVRRQTVPATPEAATQLRDQAPTVCTLNTSTVWSSPPHFSLTIFHWAPSPQHWLHHLQSIGFYLPLQFIHCRHWIICREGISLDWDFDDCPYCWEHHPLTSALQQTGGRKWRLSRVQIRIRRQTTFLTMWCPSSRGRSSGYHSLLHPLASAPPPRVSVHASTCWTPSEHRNSLTCHRAAECCSSYREARQTIQSFLLFTKVQKNHSPKVTN